MANPVPMKVERNGVGRGWFLTKKGYAECAKPAPPIPERDRTTGGNMILPTGPLTRNIRLTEAGYQAVTEHRKKKNG